MSETRKVSLISSADRIRQDLGDLSSLAESIEERGVLQPILIRSDGSLIAGARRLAACKQIGLEEIPVHVRDDLDSVVQLLKAERDENIEREDFSPSEKVILGERLEELERADRPKRGNFPRERDRKNEVREKVGRAVGLSGRTYQKAKAVVDAANAGDSIAQEALSEMDATGKIDPAYKKVKKTPPRPSKPFAADSERNRQVAEKSRLRFREFIARLDGYQQSITEDPKRLERALAVTDELEIREWLQVLKKSTKAFNQLKKALQEEVN